MTSDPVTPTSGDAGGHPEPLAIKDCTVTALATGEDARTLRELRDRLREVPDGCLYYHFWGRLLRPVYEVREFQNDFANWAAFQLRDRVLAERLALVDPADYPGPLELKEELIEIVEERLGEDRHAGVRAADEAFHFLHAELVAFDTHRQVETPEGLVSLCPDLSPSSVFYHFVDARQRNPDGRDDFQRWLEAFGGPYEGICQRLQQVDVYFSTLDELRDELADLFCAIPGGKEVAPRA